MRVGRRGKTTFRIVQNVLTDTFRRKLETFDLGSHCGSYRIKNNTG